VPELDDVVEALLRSVSEGARRAERDAEGSSLRARRATLTLRFAIADLKGRSGKEDVLVRIRDLRELPEHLVSTITIEAEIPVPTVSITR